MSAVAMNVSPASRNRSEMVASRKRDCRSRLSHRGSTALRGKSPERGAARLRAVREGKDDAVWIRRIVLIWLAKRAWRLVQRTRARRAARA